jgi:hypothetical protein
MKMRVNLEITRPLFYFIFSDFLFLAITNLLDSRNIGRLIKFTHSTYSSRLPRGIVFLSFWNTLDKLAQTLLERKQTLNVHMLVTVLLLTKEQNKK